AQADLGAVLETLLGAEVDELRPLDLRVPGDVVDVLLRVDRRDLAAELLEALDDPDGRVAMARVIGGGEPDRAGSEDRYVDDAVRAHGANSLVRAARAAARGAVRGLALFHLEGVAAAAGGGDVRGVDREARLQAFDPVDLGACDVRRAEGVDDDGDALARELVVAVLRA